MTLDEAIEYHIKVATQRAIADKEMGVNDNSKWNETKFMTKKESEQIIADNQQLAEWLTELKEVKRLLKLAVEDLNFNTICLNYDTCKVCAKRYTISCKEKFKWCYTDEALKLLHNEK